MDCISLVVDGDNVVVAGESRFRLTDGATVFAPVIATKEAM